MERLEKLIADILAVRDSEGSRRLCLDVWSLGQKHGEAEGLLMGAIILAGVTAYQRAEEGCKRYGRRRTD